MHKGNPHHKTDGKFGSKSQTIDSHEVAANVAALRGDQSKAFEHRCKAVRSAKQK